VEELAEEEVEVAEKSRQVFLQMQVAGLHPFLFGNCSPSRLSSCSANKANIPGPTRRNAHHASAIIYPTTLNCFLQRDPTCHQNVQSGALPQPRFLLPPHDQQRQGTPEMRSIIKSIVSIGSTRLPLPYTYCSNGGREVKIPHSMDFVY